MSWGQRLNMIEAALDSLHLAINRELIDLTAKGRTPQVDDMGYADFWRRIARFGPRIEMALNQIKSMEHSVERRRQAAWNVPREQRYPVRQSIRDQDRGLRQVQAKAKRIEDVLRLLQERGQTPTTADLLSGIQSLTKNVESFVGELETQALVEQPVVTTAAPKAPPAGAPSIGSLVLILTVIAAYLRKGPERD
jgi:hypothetical protein